MEQTLTQPYVFRYRNLDISKFRPNGDRYLVEVLPVDEEMVNGLYLPEQTEEQKGWAVGVVVRIGNGHRLEVPDQVAVLPNHIKVDESMIQMVMDGSEDVLKKMFDGLRTPMARRQAHDYVRNELVRGQLAPPLGYHNPRSSEEAMLVRTESCVPMFFSFGEVVFIERYSGRQFTINAREYRYVNQVDVLGSSGVFLKDADGVWLERDLEAERAAEEMKQKYERDSAEARARIVVP